MLGITADVNGRVVGRIFIQNLGDLGTGACKYAAAVQRVNTGGWEEYFGVKSSDDWLVGIEDVVHQRAAGWGALVNKVLQRPGVTKFLRGGSW